MNHAEFQKKIRSFEYSSLMYIIKDCKEAIAAQPEGHKAGDYADQIHYCHMEIMRRRKNGGKK